MADSHAHPDEPSHWWYAASVLLFGLPTLLMVIPIILMMLVEAPSLGALGVVLGVWAALGLCGLLGWGWLSICYLGLGSQGLLHASRWGWVAMKLGVAAALPVIVLLLLTGGLNALWEGFGIFLLLGPGLLLPAAHLFYLRWRTQRALPDFRPG